MGGAVAAAESDSMGALVQLAELQAVAERLSVPVACEDGIGDPLADPVVLRDTLAEPDARGDADPVPVTVARLVPALLPDSVGAGVGVAAAPMAKRVPSIPPT